MEISTIIWIGVGVLALILVITLLKGWISIYNKFIYWRNKAEGKFADIDIAMQRRTDALLPLAQTAKKYSIHEWKAFKDTTEARSRWTKDTSLNEKLAQIQSEENNFIKLQAVFEKYPKLRADKLYRNIMKSVYRLERNLAHERLEYNNVVEKYNERVERFPRNIVAKIHKFQKFNYLALGNQINQGPQESYKPREIFND